MKAIAGDVGGTNARLAAVEIDGGKASVLLARQYQSADYAGLGEIVRRFMAEARLDFDCACFGVAGPVVNGVVEATNLPWVIRVESLAQGIDIPRTAIINDFQAIGHALPLLDAQDVATLQAGEPTRHGVLALIGAGTGLGEGFLVWDADHYRVCASEGGHTTFAPRTPDEWGLQEYLGAKFGHVSYERVVSGPGLVNVYQFLAERAGETTSAVWREVEQEGAAAVSRHALAGSDALSARALDVFMTAYGAQAGNLALTVMATGGVYIAGGIAARMADTFRDGPFMAGFLDKGRLSRVLERVPVHVIVNPNAGLIGAAGVAAAL